MQDSNPFTPTRTSAEPTGAAAEQKTVSRGFEIFHNMIRGVFAFLSVCITPVFILPSFANLFGEFGVELPTLAQFVLEFSQFVCTIWLTFVPICFVVFGAIELGIFSIPSRKWKTLVNVAYWLVLVIVIGAACLTLTAVFNALFQESGLGLAVTLATSGTSTRLLA